MERITRSIELFSCKLSELSEDYQSLADVAREALKSSYSPYSKFPVGAVVLLENGEIVKGANQENAAYPSGLCAERVALFSAGALHPNQKIVALAVTLSSEISDNPIPCGACLQVISEYEQKQSTPIDVLMLHSQRDELLWSKGVHNLLPLTFNKNHLGK